MSLQPVTTRLPAGSWRPSPGTLLQGDQLQPRSHLSSEGSEATSHSWLFPVPPAPGTSAAPPAPPGSPALCYVLCWHGWRSSVWWLRPDNLRGQDALQTWLSPLLLLPPLLTRARQQRPLSPQPQPRGMRTETFPILFTNCIPEATTGPPADCPFSNQESLSEGQRQAWLCRKPQQQ